MTGKFILNTEGGAASYPISRRPFQRSLALPLAASCALSLLITGSLAKVAVAQGGAGAPPGGGGAPPASPGGGTAPAAPGSTPAAPGTAGASAGTTAPSYVIAEDDVIDVQVLDHAEVNRNYQVPAEGVIDVPYSGEINVIGMTLRDLKARLTKDFGKQFYHPDILLAAHPAQMLVDVVGVTRNGKYPLKHNEHVLEIIATAGGLPIDRPENYKATLIRNKSGEAIPINVADLYKNVASANPIMEKDDTLYIEEMPAANTTMQVIGQISHPGPIVVPRDGSILSVLQIAGGPLPGASLSAAFIRRGDQIIPVDLRDYQKTGFIPSEKLQAGDDLIIPENKREYYIFGAGQRTGAQPYPDDRKLTVFTALAYNSASTEGVDLTKVTLSHPVVGAPEKTTIIDVQHMLKTGDHSADVPVVPGDTIFVPPSSKPRGIQPLEIIGILGSLAGLVGLYSLFHH